MKDFNVYLLDYHHRENFAPFSATQAISDIKFGIFSNNERWVHFLKAPIYTIVPDYLQCKYPLPNRLLSENIYINATIIPNQTLATQIYTLPSETFLFDTQGFIAAKTSHHWNDLSKLTNQELCADLPRLFYATDFLGWQLRILEQDLQQLITQFEREPVPNYCGAVAHEDIFIEKGAFINPCFLNAINGPIIIRRGAEIQEGACIRGPVILHENSCIKMGATIYGCVTLGEGSVLGGEVKNSLFMAYSSKAHHGYIGDSIVGNWCNLGAGVTNSNIKNNAEPVQFYLPHLKDPLMMSKKMGCFIGDYTKIAIETKINTGTYIGLGCNVMNHYVLPKLIQDFSWSDSDRYQFKKLCQHLNNWKQLKNQSITETETSILNFLYHQ
ncbi:MAG: putative sugar nucleotidyl transferase [Alphaproteobacteria bacterium]|nr:putative sugar nucleotidyl transferase [Alphaproteobacteria bacterium]